MSASLDSAFSALADPTRRAIVARLIRGEATVSELSEPFELSQPTISKHLKVLEQAGLITRRRDAQRRPCRLAPEPLRAIDAWLETYREIMAATYDRLDAALDDLKTTQGEPPAKPHERGQGQDAQYRSVQGHGAELYQPVDASGADADRTETRIGKRARQTKDLEP